MEALVACDHCAAMISETALRCPICFKETKDKESLSKKIRLSAAATGYLLLTGPAGLAAGLTTGIVSFSANRQLKKIARKVSAIDSFDLSEGIVVLVTDKLFVMVLTGAGSSAEFPGFLRSDLHDVFIDESRSGNKGLFGRERTVLHLNYFDRNRRKKEVREDYKLTGKESRAILEFALLKFKEYQLP